MILQSKLDLSTFEIIRFRIWNQTSNPDDFGIGTKYFNTNSGHDGYNRENIYTDTGWRKTAYLDDIDKITNGEGSLGTRVKALEDMLNVDSAETVVSTWEEIQAFLDNVKEGTDLMGLLNSKLDKTGGTIKGDNDIPLTISQPNDGNTWIKFANAYRTLGYIGFSLSAGLAMMPNDGSKTYSLLHSGNVGEYKAGDSFRLGGYAADRYLVTQYADSDTVDLNQPLQETNRPAIVRLGGVGNHPNIPNEALQYGFLLHIGDVTKDTAWELVAGYANNSPLMFRSGTWKADGTGTIHSEGRWKTIAFTDSTVEAANRLANKVSLWGNEFDGTQDLKDNLFIYNSRSLFVTSTSTVYVAAVNMASDNVLTFGNGTNYGGNTFNTRLDGYNIYFRTGAKQTAMTITDEGNVVIGDAANTLNAKLKVNGLTFLYGVSNTPDLGNAPARGLAIGYPEFGISQWVNGNGQCYIQAGRFDGTATAYALNLNPLGGAVNIASADAPTNVLGHLFVPKDLYMGGFIFMNRGKEGIYLSGSGINWHNTNDEWSASLLTFAKDSITVKQLANFSGRVLIGSIIDDKNFKLNVAGAVKITRSDDITTYLGITVSDVLTTFNGVDTVDGYMRYSFQSHGTELLCLGSTSYFRTLVGFDKLATFNGGALIPTGQKLTIGSVTFEEDAAGRVKVDGDMYTTGTLASGGKAKEGTGTGSGSANVRDFELPADGKTTYDCDHLLKSKNVIVQVFEKTLQNNIEVWEMILTDVTIVTEDRVTVTFGRPHNKVHRVHIIGGNVS